MTRIFKYYGNNQLTFQAIDLANLIFPDVIKEMRRLDLPIMSGTRGKYLEGFSTLNLSVALSFSVSSLEMVVNEYYYRSPNVLGYYSSAKPNDININTNSYPRKVYSIVATLYHELMHKYDTLSSKDLSHGHGWTRNKYRKWKESCAPFLVDRIAENVAAFHLGIELADMIDIADTPRTNNYVSVPWWKRWMWWRY